MIMELWLYFLKESPKVYTEIYTDKKIQYVGFASEKNVYFFFFFFFFFWAAPVAFGGFQARGWIGAVATGL